MADCSGEEQNQGVSCGAPFSSLPRLEPHGSLPSELPPPEGGHTVAIKMRSQVIAFRILLMILDDLSYPSYPKH